ncbi:MAG TPA: protein kinase, partial [Kofleriaceae bacterium]|nr:protein kinase [Kofleriaceae bacterium]
MTASNSPIAWQRRCARPRRAGARPTSSGNDKPADSGGLDSTIASPTGEGPGAGADDPIQHHRFRPVGIGDTLGRYRLVDELGSGGMATVYRAVDRELRRDVAIKVLFAHLCKKREVMARFEREARAVAALDHPNILRVHDVGGGPPTSPAAGDEPVEVDPPYIVLELVRGTSLREHLDGREAILGELVACAGVVMCSALAVAHRAGIVHRDIKPANIMVAPGGRLVLADFGVARVADEDSSLVTRTGALLGTPAFMSPEQAQGEPLDERSDLYSLGATLYQMATGSMPFGGSAPRMMWAIAHGEMVPPLRRNPAMGAPLAGVIQRLMAVDPGARYATADEARIALLEVVRAAGLGEADDELAGYFADPDAHASKTRAAVISASLSAARAAMERRELPRAMALADRVLALDSGNAEALTLVDELGQGARRGRMLRGGAAALALVAVAGAAYAWWPRGAADSVVLAADAGPASVDDAAVLAQAGFVDAAAAIAPAPIDAGSAAMPAVRPPRPRAGPDAAVPIPIDAAPRVALPPPDAAPPPPKPAMLTLEMTPWCNVLIDGEDRGRANPSRPLRVAPGRHTVVCTQGPGMGEWKQTVELAPGQQLTLRGSVLRPVTVRVGVTG